MDPRDLDILLRSVRDGRVSPEEAAERLKTLPFENLGFATVDHHRALRRGFGEVIFGAGKTPEQIAAIVDRIAARGQNVLVTRTTRDVFERLLTGRTADVPVAEEAALTAEFHGAAVERIYDVGVAGLHRLLDRAATIRQATVVIVAAGMEGALPSVVGGLVEAPVIAVPTSIGYGASFQGLAALLAMLNSCASGLSVVNIDNGFGAGQLACAILRVAVRLER